MKRVSWMGLFVVFGEILQAQTTLPIRINGVLDRDNKAYMIAERTKVTTLFHGLQVDSLDRTHFPDHFGWTDIPFLLERDRSSTLLHSLLVNPKSPDRQNSCSEGMLALWIVEGIRVGGKFPSDNPLCLLPSQVTLNWETASESNHRMVALAYEQWWQHASTSMTGNSSATDPLQGTGYRWY